ncbi:hypothetical protein V6N13_131861 [Hibiscus sabdariffa]
MGASESVPQKSIHEFTVKDYKNQDVDLSIYKGKVLLVVNVASKCGLTDSNYTQLTDLYNKYKDQGSSQEAQEFACTRYKAEYPIFQKKLLLVTSSVSGIMLRNNSCECLIRMARYGPSTAPLAFEADIKKALGVDM